MALTASVFDEYTAFFTTILHGLGYYPEDEWLIPHSMDDWKDPEEEHHHDAYTSVYVMALDKPYPDSTKRFMIAMRRDKPGPECTMWFATIHEINPDGSLTLLRGESIRSPDYDRPSPRCFKCHKTAEVVFANDADREGSTPAEYARMDGTYSPANNRFACTPCYIEIGCPSVPAGWKAP